MNPPALALDFACSLLWSVALALAALLWIGGEHPPASCAGLFMAAGAPLAYRGWRDWKQAQWNSRPTVVISVITALGLATTMAIKWKYGPAIGNFHIWAAGCLVLWAAQIRLERGRR